MANKKPAALPKLAVDAALERRWAAELARFERAHTDEQESWHELYESVGEILYSDPPLYLAGGYANARAFLAASMPGADEDTVRKYVRVARYFDPPEE